MNAGEWLPFAIGLAVLFNICAFAMMGVDKRRARAKRWRIPERTLFLWAAPFSALGAWLGMKVFRHKTQHALFRIGMPALLALQCLLVMAAYIALRK